MLHADMLATPTYWYNSAADAVEMVITEAGETVRARVHGDALRRLGRAPWAQEGELLRIVGQHLVSIVDLIGETLDPDKAAEVVELVNL